MKKISLIGIIICIVCNTSAHATTLVVGKNKTYTSIKSALQHCKSADTILVESGFYKEKEIVIVSYVLDSMNYREKEFILPCCTSIEIKQ